MTNNTQLSTSTATLVGVVAGFLAGRGAFGWDQATWVSVIMGVISVATVIWTAVQTRTSSIVSQAVTSDKSTVVAAVANMPEVKEIKLDKTEPATAAISRATPDNVTAS